MSEAFKIKRLGKEDIAVFEELIYFFRAIFEMETEAAISAPYLMPLLQNPSFFAYVITSGNEVAAGLTAYELRSYYNEAAEVFIYDIGVKPAFQRQGLGKQLIESLKEDCVKNNVQVIFVEAHAEDEHAIDFYRSTGGEAEHVVHFNYYVDKRAGD